MVREVLKRSLHGLSYGEYLRKLLKAKNQNSPLGRDRLSEEELCFGYSNLHNEETARGREDSRTGGAPSSTD